MSRIGKSPIQIPSGVTVTKKDVIVEIKGPKGVLSRCVPNGITVEIKDNLLVVMRESDSAQHKALHGLTRVLLNNMVIGVTEGFAKRLIIEGIGYKATLKGKNLLFNLGYSHTIDFEAPGSIKFEVNKTNNEVVVHGIDKELVGHVAVKIRSLRKPEPYKGKGIRYADEHIRRKAGKTAGK